ncbi:MAG: hypothetical protein U0L85_00355 [Bacilli bacterium]|nr:hypothetical protein [Bacilli bacterium]
MDKQYYLFAKENIYDEYEKKILYLKDELIGSISVLKEMKEVENLLPKGIYYVQNEKKMQYQDIHIEEKLDSWQYFENILLMKQIITIDLNVIDNYQNIIINGVHCGLFAGEDIYDMNHCLVYFKDDLIMDIESNSDKWKVPLLNINEGTFYIQQIDTAEGYFGNTEQFYLNVNFKIGLVNFHVLIENQPTILEISKKDEIGRFVKGAWLVLKDEKGELVDEWISEREHILYSLVIGKRYILEEKETPPGYKQSEDVSFIVENKKDTQKILMIDQRKQMIKEVIEM